VNRTKALLAAGEVHEGFSSRQRPTAILRLF
jgi:hypothetical protein